MKFFHEGQPSSSTHTALTRPRDPLPVVPAFPVAIPVVRRSFGTVGRGNLPDQGLILGANWRQGVAVERQEQVEPQAPEVALAA